MTTEEKAKAYDKAIEKIKYVMEHGVSPTLNKEDLQDIFPELVESDDERIRKEIFHFVLENTLSIDMRQHRWLAWLEKQCKTVTETIPIESNLQVVCPYCKNTNCAYIDGHWFCPNCHREFYLKWSEEDERERKRVVGLLEGWLSTFKETCYAEDCKFGIEWLKSLKKRMEE